MVRYTGGARMLLMLEIGEGRWRLKVATIGVGGSKGDCKGTRLRPLGSYSPPSCGGWQVPVLISDLDMECQLWLKLRLVRGGDLNCIVV